MPMITQWIEPDLFFSVRGIPVFHAYKYNEYEDRLTYSFTTSDDQDDEESGNYRFDVRDLTTWKAVAMMTDEETAFKMAICEAIKTGEAKYPAPLFTVRNVVENNYLGECTYHTGEVVTKDNIVIPFYEHPLEGGFYANPELVCAGFVDQATAFLRENAECCKQNGEYDEDRLFDAVLETIFYNG